MNFTHQFFKKSIFVALCLTAFVNCNRNNDNNNQQAANAPVFNPGWNQWDYQNHFANQFGPGNYYVGNCMTGVWCYQIPQCGFSNLWAGGSCPMTTLGVVQPGFVHMYPNYGFGPSGGSFFVSAGGTF